MIFGRPLFIGYTAKMKKNQKHSNQVRIIGGSCRGRKLVFDAAEGLRPTPDMVREKLFNWLGQDLTGKSVLDVFAGSGALGLESASRNARQVVMVENNRQTANNLKQNARFLGLNQAEVCFSDGIAYLKQTNERFDVVFLDPPFAWQGWQEIWSALLKVLNDGAMVYVESGSLPEFPKSLIEYRQGKSGMSRFALLEYLQAAE